MMSLANRERSDADHRISVFLDALPVAMVMIDRDRCIRMVNAQTEKLFGYPRAELLGRSIEVLVPERLRAHHPGLVEAYFEAPEPRAMGVGRELTGLRRDGVEVPIEIGLNPVATADGLQVVASIVDISERRRAERLQTKRRELLEQLARGSELPAALNAVAMFVQQECPDAICSVLLLDETGTRLRQGAAPDLPEFYNRAIDGLEIGPEVGSCGTAAHTGRRFIAEDIETHPYWQPFRELTRKAGLRSCWSEPILGAEGRVLGTFAIYHTVPRVPSSAELEVIAIAASFCSIAIEKHRIEQKRRQVLQSLQESEERFRQMAETISGVFWLVDAATFEFLYVSPAYETIWGRSREGLGDYLSEWAGAIHPDDRERVVSLFFAAALSGEYDTEYCLVRPDGSKRWIHDRGFPIRDADGEITRIAGIAEDITDRKRIEQALRNSNEELEGFCYSVSHDLRAPLRHIDGFSQAVLEDYSAVLDAEGRNMLEMIRGAAGKMGALIDDLLSMSRVTRRDMQVEEIDLAGLAASIVEEIRSELPGRPFEFVASGKGIVPGDRRMLRVAMSCLLENAVKFSAAAQTAIVEFGSQRTEKGSVFFVRDNGVGFNMRFAGKLFVPFQRLHRDEEFPGTGVGLAIARRVIGRHGGKIWAEATEGQGATFFFTIGRELRLEADGELPSSPPGSPPDPPAQTSN